MVAWLTDISISDGGCPSPGCLHDCGPGPRREHNRAIKFEEANRSRGAPSRRKPSLGFAKKDPWVAGESRVFEKVRGILGVATTGTAPGAAGSGTTVLSPKKVRLVTPSEQGRRHVDVGTELGTGNQHDGSRSDAAVTGRDRF
jgi:hypothetical protein